MVAICFGKGWGEADCAASAQNGNKVAQNIAAYSAACKTGIASDRTVICVCLTIISAAYRGRNMSKTYSWLNPDLRSRIFQNPICSVTAFQMVWDYYR